MQGWKKEKKRNAVPQRVALDMLTTENIWQEFSDRLYGFIAKRVDSHEDARDILQDVFLKIHAKKDTLKDDRKLAAWIYQLTRNAITDHYRKANKVENGGNSAKLHEVPELMETNHYEALTDCIKPFFDRLSMQERHLIELVELKGLKQKEIAEEIGVPYSTLKTQVQRTRKKLKKMFLECCNIEFGRRGSIVVAGEKKKGCGPAC